MFEQCDASEPGALASLLRSGDLVVALHPCGALGEAVVHAVAEVAARVGGEKSHESAGADGDGRGIRGVEAGGGVGGVCSDGGAGVQMVLVSCCVAGRVGAEVADPREPASQAGKELGLSLARSLSLSLARFLLLCVGVGVFVCVCVCVCVVWHVAPTCSLSTRQTKLNLCMLTDSTLCAL